MKQPNKPQANAVTTKVGRIRSDNDPLAPENVPNVEFIDISSNKPVDPTRFQIFQLPHQFLEWVLSKEPPHLDPENLKDTGPHGIPVHPKKLVPNVVVPISETASDTPPESSRRLLPDSRIEAHEPVSPPRATTEAEHMTTEMTPRRPVGWFNRWAISGKMPRRVKVLLTSIVGGLLLILLFSRVKGGSDPTVVGDSASPAAIELLPTVSSVADRVATPVPAAATHSAEPTGDNSASSVTPRTNKTSRDQTRQSSPAVEQPSTRKPVAKSTRASQLAPVATTSNATTGVTPWFIQDN